MTTPAPRSEQTATPVADIATLVADIVGLLNDAEHYEREDDAERVRYLDRRAAVLHRLVDALGDEGARYLAQDAEDRAERGRRWAAVGHVRR